MVSEEEVNSLMIAMKKSMVSILPTMSLNRSIEVLIDS